jgi:predicted alpha/beta-fold hydrolase
MLPSTRTALLNNRHVKLVETTHGGHCAFLEPRTYWAEKMLLRFIVTAGHP